MRTGLSFIAVLAAALAVVAVSPAEPGQISSKRAEAERVLAAIDAIDMELDRAVEAYNGATVQLETINRDLAANQKRLVTARANLAAAHKRVANRVLALYTSQEPDALAVLLGSSSLGDLIERIDSVNRISKDDVRIAEDVTRFRNEVRTRQGHLVQAQARQRTIVAQRAARRSAIEGQLAERQTLLASIKDEISKLQAAEQARQETLAREARAQLRSTQTQTSGQQQSPPPPSDPPPPALRAAQRAPAGGCGLLQRRLARRDLHRQRPLRPRAPHGRRGQDLEPRRGLVRLDVRRRSPVLASRSAFLVAFGRWNFAAYRAKVRDPGAEGKGRCNPQSKRFTYRCSGGMRGGLDSRDCWTRAARRRSSSPVRPVTARRPWPPNGSRAARTCSGTARQVLPPTSPRFPPAWLTWLAPFCQAQATDSSNACVWRTLLSARHGRWRSYWPRISRNGQRACFSLSTTTTSSRIPPRSRISSIGCSRSLRSCECW